MMSRLASLMRGEGLRGRAIRSSLWTFLSFGGANLLRLISNLILTRLLFPEMFGLMALVQVVLTGMEMISDTGVNTSIIQNKRGEDPIFLRTAWTFQILRGLVLWLVTIAIASPLAQFYEQPQLAQILPVAGISVFFFGLQSTKFSLAQRNLVMGRMAGLEIGAQFIGMIIMVALAYWTRSIWALVIGWVVGSALRTALTHLVLPGERDRLGWDKEIMKELFDFGKYILVGSSAGFLINNADRAILGKFIAIGALGIYNIGYFFASVPFTLSRQFMLRILLPVFSQAPTWEDPGNLLKVRKARLGLSGLLLGISFLLALSGDFLVRLLYEDTYALAGPIVVLLSLAYMPMLITNNYGAAMLAAGDSKVFTVSQIVTAVVQTALLYFVIKAFGLIGTIIAPIAAAVLVYPLMAVYAARYKAWDPLLDLGLGAFTVLSAILVLWVNDGVLAQVLAQAPE